MHNSVGSLLRVSSPVSIAEIQGLSSFSRFFEQYPDRFPTLEDDTLIVGIGLGQLSAAALSCSKTLIDLIVPAVEAVSLAFLIGGIVGNHSSDFQQMDSVEEYWSISVPGCRDEIDLELQVFQDQMVCLNPSLSVLFACIKQRYQGEETPFLMFILTMQHINMKPIQVARLCE